MTIGIENENSKTNFLAALILTTVQSEIMVGNLNLANWQFGQKTAKLKSANVSLSNNIIVTGDREHNHQY